MEKGQGRIGGGRAGALIHSLSTDSTDPNADRDSDDGGGASGGTSTGTSTGNGGSGSGSDLVLPPLIAETETTEKREGLRGGDMGMLTPPRHHSNNDAAHVDDLFHPGAGLGLGAGLGVGHGSIDVTEVLTEVGNCPCVPCSQCTP